MYRRNPRGFSMALVPRTYQDPVTSAIDDLLSDVFDPFQNRAPYMSVPGWSLATPRLAQDFGIERQSAEVTNDKDKFSVKLDVSHYAPEELQVTTRNNEVIIEGKHEERKDSQSEQGYISRQFTRRYVLPEDAQWDQLSSSLNGDGTLLIHAPKNVAAVEGERKIPIQMAKTKTEDKAAVKEK